MSSRILCSTRRSSLARLTYYKKPTSEQAFPVYVENIIVRDIQLAALPKQPDIPQLRAEDSKKIVLVLPREGSFFHHRPGPGPSLPWDHDAKMHHGLQEMAGKRRVFPGGSVPVH